MRKMLFLAMIGAAAALGALIAPRLSGAKDAARVPRAEAEAWVQMLMYADDDRDLERRLAALRLGVHRQAWALDTLMRQMRGDRDPRVRAACAYAVGRIGGDQAVNALAEALDDNVREVRLAVIDALAGQASPYALRKLDNLAHGADDATALAAARALDQHDRLGAERLKNRQRPDEPPVAPATALVYVDPAGGNDADPGRPEKPVKTIARGLALLQPGGALLIAGLPGGQPIREPVVVPAALSGEPAAPTRIMAWPGKPRPVISPTRPLPAASFVPAGAGLWKTTTTFRALGAFAARGSQAVVLSMTDAPGEDTPNHSWFDPAKNELTIRLAEGGLPQWVEVGFAPQGVTIQGAHDVVVQDLDVRFAPDSGLMADGALRASFVGCTASYCDRHGIFFYYSPQGTARGCRTSYCAFQGVSVRSSPRTIVTGCQATDNGVDGILFLFDSDDGLVVDSVARGNFRGATFIEDSVNGRVIGGAFAGNRETSVSFESGSVGGQVIPPP